MRWRRIVLPTRSGSTCSSCPTARSRSAPSRRGGSWSHFPPGATGPATRSGRTRLSLSFSPMPSFRPISTVAVMKLRGARGSGRSRRPQPDARAVPLAQCRPLRRLPARMGDDLRTLRRTRRDRPGAGHRRVGLQRHRSVPRARARVLPVAAGELEPTQAACGAARNRGIQPDDAGAVLRGVPHDPRHQIRQLHSGAVRAPRRRHERRHERSSTASGWAARMCASTTSSAANSSAIFAAWRRERSAISTAPTALAPRSTPRWSSATSSTSSASWTTTPQRDIYAMRTPKALTHRRNFARHAA